VGMSLDGDFTFGGSRSEAILSPSQSLSSVAGADRPRFSFPRRRIDLRSFCDARLPKDCALRVDPFSSIVIGWGVPLDLTFRSNPRFFWDVTDKGEDGVVPFKCRVGTPGISSSSS